MIEYLTIPKLCPICGASTKIIESASGVLNLFCSNENCSGKLISRLENFAGKKGLDIKGLSKATLDKLIDWGWVSAAADLYTLVNYSAEWKTKPGFGERSVENILKAIEDSRKPTLESFISAIGIPAIGRTLSKEIAKYFKSYEEFRDAAKNHWDFTQIDKIGYEKALNIWNFNFDEADAVDEYILAYTSEEPAAADNLTLEGHKIAITGTLTKTKNRSELQKLIEAHGGKVVTSVTKNTTILINNDVKSTSSKNVSAERLGIPILTEEEFWNLYLEN